MERKIIELKDLKFDDIKDLKDYIWKGAVLIPAELVYGK